MVIDISEEKVHKRYIFVWVPPLVSSGVMTWALSHLPASGQCGDVGQDQALCCKSRLSNLLGSSKA